MSKRSPKRPSPSPIKPEEVFGAAASYEYSSSVLFDRCRFTIQIMENAGINVDAVVPPTLIPGIVFDALSAELYLKCLIQLENGLPTPPVGHKLALLFSQVSAVGQAKIRQAYKAISDHPAVAACDAATAAKFGIPDLFTFDRVLKAFSNAFVQWRYYHENGMPSSGLARLRIANSVKSVILERQPDWTKILGRVYLIPTYPGR